MVASDAVGQTCEALAATYGLSPREAQILPMVVEGGSAAAYISRPNWASRTAR